MGRKKINTGDQKQTIAVRVPNELYACMEGIKNKSKFIGDLLVEYFKQLNCKQLWRRS